MGALSKEVVQEIIRGNNFQNPGEVLAFLKDAFKDVLQELEVEMDANLGYSRDETPKKNIDNSRNGYSYKTVHSELGPVQLDILKYSLRTLKQYIQRAVIIPWNVYIIN